MAKSQGGSNIQRGWCKVDIAMVGVVLTSANSVTRRAQEQRAGDFPGGPVAETPCSQCKVPRFNP